MGDQNLDPADEQSEKRQGDDPMRSANQSGVTRRLQAGRRGASGPGISSSGTDCISPIRMSLPAGRQSAARIRPDVNTPLPGEVAAPKTQSSVWARADGRTPLAASGRRSTACARLFRAGQQLVTCLLQRRDHRIEERRVRNHLCACRLGLRAPDDDHHSLLRIDVDVLPEDADGEECLVRP